MLLGIPHHTLERGALVRFAADRAVFIGGGDGQPQLCGVLSAGFNLLFDGNIPLIVGRIAGVDDRIAAVCLLFFAHKNTSGYTLTSLPGGGTITSARSVIALDRFYPVPSLSKLIWNACGAGNTVGVFILLKNGKIYRNADKAGKKLLYLSCFREQSYRKGDASA